MTDTIRLRILSLGAGVQSTTMALMAARGEIGPMPDCAIFADTGWEPRAIYEYLDWIAGVLPFPVHRVRRAGLDLGELAIKIANDAAPRSAMPPWYTSDPKGMLPRQCSKEFKTRVVGRKVRDLLGLRPRQHGPKNKVVEQWMGISCDEMSRMKDAEQSFVQNRWPLIEKEMTRTDCLSWMERHGYPAPSKSSCIFCPYRSAGQWREMRDNAPDDWDRAVAFDAKIRAGFTLMKGEAFVHRQRVPLDQVDLSTPEEREHPNLFLDECEGMCGV